MNSTPTMQDKLLSVAKDEIMRLTIKAQKVAPFYSYIIMHMRCTATVDSSLPSGAVNASGDLFYNPTWFMELTKEERLFFLLHEAGHMALMTFPRKATRDHILWNIATDLIINQMLVEDGYTPIKDCLVPDKHGVYVIEVNDTSHAIQVLGRTAEQIYEDLLKIKDTVNEALVNPNNGSLETSYKGGFDGHVYEVSGSSEQPDPADGTPITPADIDKLATKWRRVISSANVVAKQAGVQSSIQGRFIDKILKPAIDWKSVLNRFVQNKLPTDFSMKKPGRRSMSLGYYTPTIIREGLHVVVAPDVSGSIQNKEYIQFMSEIHSILHSSNQIHLTIVPWAADVLDEDVLDIPIGTRKNIFNYKINNSGGTKINSIGDYLKKTKTKPDMCIVFTDGYISESNPKALDCPTLAVINKGGDENSLKRYATQITCLDNSGL